MFSSYLCSRMCVFNSIICVGIADHTYIYMDTEVLLSILDSYVSLLVIFSKNVFDRFIVGVCMFLIRLFV